MDAAKQFNTEVSDDVGAPSTAPSAEASAPAPSPAPQPTAQPPGPSAGALAAEAVELAKVRRDRDRYVAFAFCASDILMELNADGAVVAAAGAIAALIHADLKMLKGQNFLDIVDPRDRYRGDEMLQAFQAGKRGEPVLVRLTHHGEAGGSVPFAISGCWLSEMDGHYFMSMRRSTQVPKTQRRKIESVVKSEPIGDLLGTDEFANRTVDKIKRAKSDGQDCRVSLLQVDNLDALESRLDGATRIELKNRITAILQEGSVDGGLAGALGEGKFGVVLDRDVHLKDLTSRISGMTETVDPEGKGVVIQGAELDTEGVDFGDQDAINLLSYSINSFASGTEGGVTMDQIASGLPSLMNETGRQMKAVRRVIEDRRFQPHFQPIVHLESRSCSHYEALSRLTDSALELPPQEFILFCEQTKMIREFDLAMVRKVVETLSALNAKGENLRIATNLAGPSLDDGDFRGELMDILASSKIPPALMMFEITESSALVDPAQTNHYVQDLREAGYQVCLDDFGSGAASLEYLRELEIDVVKIDGSYTRESLKSKKGAVLFQSMIDMCQNLELKTVAEMVEDEADVAFLTKAGVDYGQGWYFGRPAPEVPNYSDGSSRPVPARRRGEVESWS